jgi:hypothetical protein
VWTLRAVGVRGKTQKTDISHLELVTTDPSVKEENRWIQVKCKPRADG